MKRLSLYAMLTAILAVSPLVEPRLLAFPYHETIGEDDYYAEQPVERAALAQITSRADRLVQGSPIALPNEGRNIFLTDGGWRWRWLANLSSGAFGLTRPLSEAVIVNRSIVGRDEVFNGATIAGDRKLSGVIAHEKTHGMIRRHFGMLASRLKPTWLIEGYCDYVAGESSLTDSEAKQLVEAGSFHPALPYYTGHLRVKRAVETNGVSVDRLFAGVK